MAQIYFPTIPQTKDTVQMAIVAFFKDSYNTKKVLYPYLRLTLNGNQRILCGLGISWGTIAKGIFNFLQLPPKQSKSVLEQELGSNHWNEAKI